MSDRVAQSENGTRVRWDLLTSVPFVVSLALLALNDWALKGAFGNALTGKLSDFAGLFAFGVFLCAFMPARPRLALLLAGGWFVLWKSPLAQPLIGAWNGLPVFDVARVVDYTDLIALAVLPLVGLLAARPCRPGRFALRPVRYALVLFSVVVFTATSKAATPVPYAVAYQVALSREDVLKAMDHFTKFWVGPQVHEFADTVSVWFDEGYFVARILVTGDDSSSVVRLLEIGHWADPESVEPWSLLRHFDRIVMTPIYRAATDDSLMAVIRARAPVRRYDPDGDVIHSVP